MTDSIVRLLRMAAACQLVQQLPDGTFAHTKFSRGYAMDPGPGLAFNLLYAGKTSMRQDSKR